MAKGTTLGVPDQVDKVNKKFIDKFFQFTFDLKQRILHLKGLHSRPNDGAGTKDGAGTSETNGNVPGSASGSEEAPKAGTDAETCVGITAPLTLRAFVE